MTMNEQLLNVLKQNATSPRFALTAQRIAAMLKDSRCATAMTAFFKAEKTVHRISVTVDDRAAFAYFYDPAITTPRMIRACKSPKRKTARRAKVAKPTTIAITAPKTGFVGKPTKVKMANGKLGYMLNGVVFTAAEFAAYAAR